MKTKASKEEYPDEKIVVIRSSSKESSDVFDKDNHSLFNFEEKLKKNEVVKKFMRMSPSIPNGFDENCTMLDEHDFSTLICQALISNDYYQGLREQRYMNID
jgi:hypothetical protein